MVIRHHANHIDPGLSSISGIKQIMHVMQTRVVYIQDRSQRRQLRSSRGLGGVSLSCLLLLLCDSLVPQSDIVIITTIYVALVKELSRVGDDTYMLHKDQLQVPKRLVLVLVKFVPVVENTETDCMIGHHNRFANHGCG